MKDFFFVQQKCKLKPGKSVICVKLNKIFSKIGNFLLYSNAIQRTFSSNIIVKSLSKMVSGTKRNAFLIGIALLVLSNLIDNASSNDIISNDSDDVGGLFYFSVYFLCLFSCFLFGHLNRQVFDTKRSTSINLFTLHCN